MLVKKLILTALAMAPLAGLYAADAPARKPNIIFILADDLGIGNVSCCGADHFKRRTSTRWQRVVCASSIAVLRRFADLALPGQLEGTSFKLLMENPALPWKTAAFSQYPRPGSKSASGPLMGYTMRTDRYRFTIWGNREDHTLVAATELYDHQTDPQENYNIARRPANATLVAKLLEQWKKGWQAAKPSLSQPGNL